VLLVRARFFFPGDGVDERGFSYVGPAAKAISGSIPSGYWEGRVADLTNSPRHFHNAVLSALIRDNISRNALSSRRVQG